MQNITNQFIKKASYAYHRDGYPVADKDSYTAN